MGILKVIVVAFERDIPLRGLIDSFMVQTSDKWELHIIHDGTSPKNVKEVLGLYSDKRINFYESKTRNQNYGHPNRKMMLEKIEVEKDDFILLTNDDNYYTRNFVSTVMSNATKIVGMVHFDMLHNYFQYDVLRTIPKINNIDMGAFIVRGTIAQQVGFKSNKFEADGIYCEACVKACQENKLRIVHLDKIMFIHN